MLFDPNYLNKIKEGKTMKHTGEPWEFVEESQAIGATNDLYETEHQERKYICMVVDDYNHETNTANAQRIVECVNACEGINPKAVPELLEACKAIIENKKLGRVASKGTDRVKSYDVKKELFDNLEQAIAAAEATP